MENDTKLWHTRISGIWLSDPAVTPELRASIAENLLDNLPLFANQDEVLEDVGVLMGWQQQP